MTQLTSTLRRRMLPAHHELLEAAGKAAQRHGLELFLVGGAVRDLLLGRSVLDLDIAAVGLTEARLQALAGDLGGRVTAQSQFGTAKLDAGGSRVDLAMARKESYSAPGALPEVSPGSMEDDLARRDFTINAMAVSLMPDSWGGLLDPHDGRHDLEDELVRTLHARSFVDDATRILRAVRYSARLDFRIETSTSMALRRDLRHLDAIKGDRVRHELDRVFDEERATAALAMARDLGVLRTIDPALAVDDGTLDRLSTFSDPGAPDRALIFLSALAYPLSRIDAARLTARLNLDSRFARAVRDSQSINESDDELRSPGLGPRRLHGLLNGLDPVAVQGASLAVSDSELTERLRLYVDKLRHVTTILNGDDLMAMGVPEGPPIGRMLDELLAAKLDGLLATREDEEAFVVHRVASGLDST